mmetsp:Transcript_145299/g.404976  ORF Transcript_145299/g.404976 Transcript_145299/m.404976 type:complete len:246 (-) Transcript_145299:452-1189(-)
MPAGGLLRLVRQRQRLLRGRRGRTWRVCARGGPDSGPARMRHGRLAGGDAAVRPGLPGALQRCGLLRVVWQRQCLLPLRPAQPARGVPRCGVLHQEPLRVRRRRPQAGDLRGVLRAGRAGGLPPRLGLQRRSAGRRAPAPRPDGRQRHAVPRCGRQRVPGLRHLPRLPPPQADRQSCLQARRRPQQGLGPLRAQQARWPRALRHGRERRPRRAPAAAVRRPCRPRRGARVHPVEGCGGVGRGPGG